MDDSRQTCPDSSEMPHDDYDHDRSLYPDRGGWRQQGAHRHWRGAARQSQGAARHYQGAARHRKADTLRCRRDHHQTDCRPRNSHFTVCNRHILPRNTPIAQRIHIIQHPGRVCSRRRTFAAVLCPVLVHLLARLRLARRGGVFGATSPWALSSGRHYR